MDEMVLTVQQWVNATYNGRYGYNLAPENGKTGWSTMYALTRALQIELGITEPSDNFGNGTKAAYKAWGEMEIGKVPTDNKGQNIVKILQGACYCKGYNPTGFTGTFGEGTKAAVIQLQTDAGLPVRDGKVYDYVFKAFLTMDAYVLITGGDPRIRQMQQDLNFNYYTTAGVQPCDGYFQRNTNKALIYGIQTEEGIAPEDQTGSVGPTTQSRLPTLSVGSTGSFVKLFQYALYTNGFDPGEFNGSYGEDVKSVVMSFQEFCMLTVDGIADKQTWLSALISTGDPNRKGTACDCVTEITVARAESLKAAGYHTVGRYLTNVENSSLNKKIQPGELETIFNAGLTVFPIYQTVGSYASYFNDTQGYEDGQAAYNAARKYGFKNGTIIYFAVDFDALGDDITNNIIPHFQGINRAMENLGSAYQIGVYGPRNVCIQVSNNGLAKTSFVSGMSTGYSGNLGYPLPRNWAFDQISTISVGSGDGYIQIDNDIQSGRDPGVSAVDDFFDQFGKIQLLALQYTNNWIWKSNYLVTNYYRRHKYIDSKWTYTSGPFDEEFEAYVNSSLGDNPFINLIDPVTKISLDMEHSMATLSALMVYEGVPIIGVSVQDFAGWAGDLYTMAKDVAVNRYLPQYQGLEWDQATYQCAYDSVGSESEYAINFSLEDLLGDADAVNLAQLLLDDPNATLYSKVVEYYNGTGVQKRFRDFFVNEFGADTEQMRSGALDVLISADPDLIAARVALGEEYANSYDDNDAQQMANGFTDKITALVLKESL